MAKTNNSLNLKQIEGSINIKQGDSKSLLSYQLLDENDEPITDVDGQTAIISLVGRRDNVIYFQTTSTVKSGIVEFNITSILQPGKYLVEIECNGYVFPSDQKTKIKVTLSAVIGKVENTPVQGTTITDDHSGIDPLAAYNLAKI